MINLVIYIGINYLMSIYIYLTLFIKLSIYKPNSIGIVITILNTINK